MKPVEVWRHVPPDALEPVVGVVNVFSAPLDIAAPRLDELSQWLSDEELQRAQRFHLERDRGRFIAGRGVLREILGALLNLDPKVLVISRGEFGKPRLSAPVAARSLHFNLAHADSIAVYATGRHELGVDLERVCVLDETAQIASRCFSPREADFLLALPVEKRPAAFFHCWTRKEAYLKAIGLGLPGGLDAIEILPAPAAAVERLGVPNYQPPWSLHALNPAAGFVGALAIQPADGLIQCWKWNRLP